MNAFRYYLKKHVFIGLLLILFILTGFGQNDSHRTIRQTDETSVDNKVLDGYLTQASNFGFSGVVLVAINGSVKFRKAYGMADRDRNISNNVNTVFDIGSITKQFTAAAIMKLEMQGKLKTGDPINKYLEGVPEDKVQVTIHQLLTHTAGFPEYSGGDYEKSERDETIKRILTAPLAFKPGEKYEYSNAAYSVLAAIIEKISGKTYESFLNENLFKPSGMTQTGYVLPKFDKSALPHGYVLGKDEKTPLDHQWSAQGPYWNLVGNGGILSTAQDMFSWYKALQGNAIFSVEARRKMFTPVRNDYGYGWEIEQTSHGQSIGHNGGNDVGFTAHIRWFPEKGVCVIIMSNTGYYFDTGNYANLIGKKITGLIFGEKIPPQQNTKLIKPDALNFKNFEGTYVLPSGEKLEVKEQFGQLLVNSIGQGPTDLLTETVLNLSLEEASKKTNTILEGMVKKDFQPFILVFEKEDIAKRYQAYLEKKMKDWESKEGAFRGFHVLGTVLDWWADNSIPITIIKMDYEKQSHIFRFHWKDGKIIAIGGEGIPNPGMTPLQPISKNEFVGWHLSFAKSVRIQFAQNSLTIVSGGKTGHAVKE